MSIEGSGDADLRAYLVKGYGANLDIDYNSEKSNPNKNILNLLNQHGVNFDCASKNELYTVVNSFKKPTKYW